VSGYPVLLDGERVTALVVGGGAVAHRKAVALLESGATVRLIALRIGSALRDAGPRYPRLALVERGYAPTDIGPATLVVAATDSRALNARIAADAAALGRLVNVADAPEEGDYVTMATHRAGSLVIAVSAGGVPGAARRVRDALAERFDARYGGAIAALSALRSALRAEDSARWAAAARSLIGPDFCATVESGAFPSRAAEWR
jgi:precorrin-2 dehydrogenase/sirohydrochlorin ferrochelatase